MNTLSSVAQSKSKLAIEAKPNSNLKLGVDNPPLIRPKRTKLPRNILILDTEAVISYPEPDHMVFTFKMGCLLFIQLNKAGKITNRKVYYLNTLDDFYFTMDYLSAKNKEIFLFGHNIGFDFRVLLAFRTFHKMGFSSAAPIINHRVFIWRLTRKRHVIRVIDTANLGVISVKKLGKDLNLPKLEVDFETTDSETLRKYCLRDCEILEKFLLGYIGFIREHKLGGFKSTLAAQALHSFLTRFYHDDIFPHHFPTAVELEQNAYHGGRTEVFALGTQPEQEYFLLDINSMYPAIMATHYLPNRFVSYTEDDTIKITPRLLSDYYLIAECDLDTDENAYPLLISQKDLPKGLRLNPKHRHAGMSNTKRLCFPTGKFTTTLHHCELVHALLHNHVLKIRKLAVYEKAPIFKDFANFYLDMRQHYRNQGNDTYSYVAKITANSLYGKMAQHRYIRKKIAEYAGNEFGRMPFYDIQTKVSGEYILWNNTVYKEYTEGYARHSFLAIAGAITAIGRNNLYILITMAGKENTFLCDTDSLLCNMEGYENLKTAINKDNFGALKLEKQATRLVIHGVKDYELGDRKRRKGIKENAENVTDIDGNIKENEFMQWNFSSMIAWLNSGGEGTADAKRIVKTRHGDYYKGIRDDKSGRITPYHLD